MTEYFDEEIFDGNMGHAVAVVYWLVHLLGDKVYFPVEETFWIENFPEKARLALVPEGDKLVLMSEVLDDGS